MSNFSITEPSSFGLDISTLSLKIVRLKKSKKGIDLASFGETKVPKGIIEGGEVKDVLSLSETIEKAIKEVKGEKLKAKHVVLSLPEEKSFVDVFEVPKMAEEEIESAVKFEAESHIPVSMNEVYFDFEKIESGSENENQEILINACPKGVVDPYLDAVKSIGLRPMAVEVECLSLARSLMKRNEISSPTLIVDFGGTRTTFVIYSGKSIRFTSTIEVSSNKLTESISNNLKISLEKAEKIKKENGLKGEQDLKDAIVPPLTDLVEQIQHYMGYYHSHGHAKDSFNGGQEIEKVLLCGGGANLEGLVGFISSHLRKPVELGNPWINILEEPLNKVPEISYKKSLSYTTALGLALKALYGN